MRLYDEIFKNEERAFSRCIVVPNGGGYFEGVKAVTDFTSECIVLCFSRQSVEIQGQNLCIKKYCDGDLEITGEIVALRVLGGEEKNAAKER